MWTHDLRQALRLFRREPAFAAAAVLTLTLGIGANTALFTLVEAVLLRPLPFDDATKLVLLRHRDVQTGRTKPDVAIGDFLDLRARQQSFESLAGFNAFHSTYFGGDEPVRVEGAALTPDALRALRIQPALGRSLEDPDARANAAPVVMVSQEFWRTHLGSDAQVLSRSIQLGATRRVVVGVLPAGFRFPPLPRADVIVPLALPSTPPPHRRAGWVYALGRLRSGETLARAEADVTSLSRQFEAKFPDENRGSRYEAVALAAALVGDTRRPLVLLSAAVGFVLLIACANVANLLLARAIGRQHEFAVRRALGATRGRLLAQVLVEGLALALAGSLLGVAIAWFAAPTLAALIPNASSIPGLEQVGVRASAVMFAAGAAIASAVLFSALAAAGLGGTPAALPGRRAGTMTRRSTAAASTLVAAEIAMAVVLVAGAGLTIRSFSNLLAVDPGFRPDGVLTLQLALPEGRYEADDARRAFFTRAFAEIAALERVEAVGAAMVTPLTGNNWTVPLQRVEHPVAPGQRPPEVGWQLASEGYFQALRIPLRRGRLFNAADATGAPVVIVSEAVAARFFPGEDPVGRGVTFGDMHAEIVGIVGDVRRAALADDPRADLYFPFERVVSPSTTLFVRAGGEPAAVMPALRAAVRRIEPDAVLYEVRTLADVAEDSASVTRLATRLLTGFAVMAMVLAILGVYGVMSYRVRRRSHELGTRVALGATPRDLARLVLRDAATMSALGLAAGLFGALVFARTLSSVLFEVAPWDPATLAATAGLLALATLAGSYLPARRAARVDPVVVLAAD